jgi:hypothetical protein
MIQKHRSPAVASQPRAALAMLARLATEDAYDLVIAADAMSIAEARSRARIGKRF